MLIPSIIALSLVLLIAILAFLTHNATNTYSYDYKSKPYKPLCVSSAIITLIGLAALVAAIVVSIVDEYDGIQTPLFFFGLVTSFFGVLQFYLYLVGFVGIKGNDIHIRVSFRTKKAKISDIKTILRGPYDFIIKLKDGYKAPFIGDDIVVNKIIERLDDEVLVMDFADTSYLWNNPKKMKRNKILFIVGGIVSIFGLAVACVLNPFDKPIHEEDAILVSGELDYSSYIGQYNYFFYLKGSDFGERMEKYGTRVYLINTGWTGGPYGVGSRINLTYTRAMVTAALNGEIENAEFVRHPIFNVDVPQHIENVPDIMLNPKSTWKDKAAYDAQAKRLAAMFEENAAKKYPNMDEDVRAAGPHSA